MSMPINNELIDETLNKLSKKRNEINNEAHQIQNYIQTLLSIKTHNDEKMPIDTLTGEPMSEERRNEIFNSVVKRAGKYLGGNNK